MKKLDRRSFAKMAALTAATPMFMNRTDAKAAPLPLSFSTLGCPKWDWGTILAQASKMGFGGIEFRGIQGEMDLTKRPEFAGTGWKASLKDLRSRSLRVAGLGASTQLHESDATKRQAGMDSAKKFIELAHNLQCPYIRVFGDKFVEGQSREATNDRIVAGLQELGAAAKGTKVTVLMETHGDFNRGDMLRDLIKRADTKQVGLLWDAHHTVMFGNEQPALTWEKIGSEVRHVHLKDSRRKENDVQYVLFGDGVVPLREIVTLLSKGGYSGFYSLEWEKGWHPELEEPEIAFPRFIEKMHEFLPSREVG